MKTRGSEIVVKALEDESVRFTFGIPGTHNTELYDALDRSAQIEPVLVTDEQSASFMADGVSRSGESVGVVNVVPGAGVTHCLSGVAEAFMDNIPLLVLACGIRQDTGNAYQLHDIDQMALLAPVTKAAWKVSEPSQIYPTVRRALALARRGTPGPVAVEIPADFYILRQGIDSLEYAPESAADPVIDEEALAQAAAALNEARLPAIYAGYGARAAAPLLVKLAEALGAPVATTIQGKGVFPEQHALWLWNGFGNMAPPFVQKIMARCDCLLAIGCRFGEVATASYGMKPPANLIHVDINPEVFHRNYPARLALASDASAFIEALLPKIKKRTAGDDLRGEIKKGHAQVREKWQQKASIGKVTPAALFATLQRHAQPEAVYVTDSGNGTFLAMEHLRLDKPGRFLAPVDYSCMGYSAPAAIGAKFANPNRDVIALTGDGALLMTGLELLTAAHYGAAPAVFVLRDRQLGQISQFQKLPLNKTTCSDLAGYDTADLAKAARCEYLALSDDGALSEIVPKALDIASKKQPVLVDVAIDYTQKTYFTKGVVTTNFWRFPWAERVAMLARAAGRRVKPG